MKKIIILFLTLLIAFVSCNREPVTEQYLIVYSFPDGTDNKEEPKFWMGKIKYPTDSAAISAETIKYSRQINNYLKNFAEEANKSLKPSNTEDKNMQNIRLDAIQNLIKKSMDETRIFLSISYNGKLDYEKFFKIIKEHGLTSREAEEYVTEHNIKVNTANILYDPDAE